MSDLINRQAAIDAMNARLEDIKLTWRGKVKKGEIAMYLDMRGVIEILQSAEPVQHAKWIVKHTFYKNIPVPYNVWSCSFCGHVRKQGWAATQEGQKPTAVFCENCSARMDK